MKKQSRNRALTAYFVPQDIRTLREQMTARAELDRQTSNS